MHIVSLTSLKNYIRYNAPENVPFSAKMLVLQTTARCQHWCGAGAAAVRSRHIHGVVVVGGGAHCATTSSALRNAAVHPGRHFLSRSIALCYCGVQIA